MYDINIFNCLMSLTLLKARATETNRQKLIDRDWETRQRLRNKD